MDKCGVAMKKIKAEGCGRKPGVMGDDLGRRGTLELWDLRD